MSALVIPDVDPALRRRLERRAARNGRTLEAEVVAVLEAGANDRVAPAEPPPLEVDAAYRARLRASVASRPSRSVEERARSVARIRALAFEPGPPFDLKAFSDALSDGTE